ncbi:MAG: HAMP domain-containing sensor histidine kinase [Candidatus Paceibacterota bacterium]
MNFENILSQFDIQGQCKKYGISIWQHPQFLFIVMGVVIIISALLTYTIGTKYINDPYTVALLVLILAVVLFIISTIITQSFERLAEASRMKSEFVSIVSHQLRSPLSNLKWSIELLMSGKINSISEKELEYYKILKENSDRMTELISDLLIVSKIETAKLPIKNSGFSLAELTEELINFFRPLIMASNIEVTFKPDKSLSKVFADPSQIRLVVENLLGNAIRYVKGKGAISIKLENVKNHTLFEIKDDGVGIPKEDQKFIFQKFFRSKNALRHQTQGSGLGLYIAKAIVEKSGGKIGFKSEENKGSTFWFTLPINKK